MSHHCHMTGCTTPTPPRLFMCPKHWAKVPAAIQARVWATFKANPTPTMRLRSRGYMEACADAVDAVAKAEGSTGRNTYRAVLAAQEKRGALIE